jgi:hypothetical protein
MPYQRDWDESVGLWKRKGPGHTKGVHDLLEVHEGRAAANKLVAAALDGQLATVAVGRVLAALESMQQVGGPRHGCFRWYFEEREVRDTNAAFFIGLPLIALRAVWSEQLVDEDRARLERMLSRLREWFDHELAHPSPVYPNKYLGDLVCGWLLAEMVGEIPTELPSRLLDAAIYWQEQEWGWGEHMSDLYAGICLDELAMLLLLSRRLPSDVRAAYERLRDELLAIDDLYAGGPRVPVIRCYAFTESPKVEPYRRSIRPWKTEDLEGYFFQPLRALACRLGWHETVPAPASRPDVIEIDCHGGARARALIAGPLRVGVMSRYPIMEGIDHLTWGLSWQSFPVAAWHASGDWVFLQWEATENGRRRTHPAESKADSYLGNALSEQLDPPPVGVTHSLRVGRTFVVLRQMPRVSPGWTELVDRVRVVNRTGGQPTVRSDGEVHELSMRFEDSSGPGHELRVSHIALGGTTSPSMEQNAFGGFDWSIRHRLGDDARGLPPTGLWLWSLNDASARGTGVSVHVVEGGWRVSWQEGDRARSMLVAPRDPTPLRLADSR